MLCCRYSFVLRHCECGLEGDEFLKPSQSFAENLYVQAQPTRYQATIVTIVKWSRRLPRRSLVHRLGMPAGRLAAEHGGCRQTRSKQAQFLERDSQCVDEIEMRLGVIPLTRSPFRTVYYLVPRRRAFASSLHPRMSDPGSSSTPAPAEAPVIPTSADATLTKTAGEHAVCPCHIHCLSPYISQERCKTRGKGCQIRREGVCQTGARWCRCSSS